MVVWAPVSSDSSLLQCSCICGVPIFVHTHYVSDVTIVHPTGSDFTLSVLRGDLSANHGNGKLWTLKSDLAVRTIKLRNPVGKILYQKRTQEGRVVKMLRFWCKAKFQWSFPPHVWSNVFPLTTQTNHSNKWRANSHVKSLATKLMSVDSETLHKSMFDSCPFKCAEKCKETIKSKIGWHAGVLQKWFCPLPGLLSLSSGVFWGSYPVCWRNQSVSTCGPDVRQGKHIHSHRSMLTFLSTKLRTLKTARKDNSQMFVLTISKKCACQ